VGVFDAADKDGAQPEACLGERFTDCSVAMQTSCPRLSVGSKTTTLILQVQVFILRVHRGTLWAMQAKTGRQALLHPFLQCWDIGAAARVADEERRSRI